LSYQQTYHTQTAGQDPQTIRPRTYSNIGRLDDVSEPQHDGKLTRFFKSTASLVTKPFLGSGRRSKEETRELVEAIQNLVPPRPTPFYKGPPEKLVNFDVSLKKILSSCNSIDEASKEVSLPIPPARTTASTRIYTVTPEPARPYNIMYPPLADKHE